MDAKINYKNQIVITNESNNFKPGVSGSKQYLITKNKTTVHALTTGDEQTTPINKQFRIKPVKTLENSKIKKSIRLNKNIVKQAVKIYKSENKSIVSSQNRSDYQDNDSSYVKKNIATSYLKKENTL